MGDKKVEGIKVFGELNCRGWNAKVILEVNSLVVTIVNNESTLILSRSDPKEEKPIKSVYFFV